MSKLQLRAPLNVTIDISDGEVMATWWSKNDVAEQNEAVMTEKLEEQARQFLRAVQQAEEDSKL